LRPRLCLAELAKPPTQRAEQGILPFAHATASRLGPCEVD
jgi:hypothetical protein